MNISAPEFWALCAALVGILAVGASQPKMSLWLYALQTFTLSTVTALYGLSRSEPHLLMVAAVIFIAKAVLVPLFLRNVIDRINVADDSGFSISAPLAMHLSVCILGLAYLLSKQLPTPLGDGAGWPGACAGISILCNGLLIMLTRRLAISQIIGFLVMENGIYIFGLTQTKGMPLMVELGIMLDLLVGVMVCGLLAFRIFRSFEHIDVTALSELKE